MVKLLVFLFMTITICWAGPSDIVRPCKLSDYKCIGRNLAANSNCNPNVKGYLRSRYRVPRFVFKTPSFNATYIETNLIVKDHDKCYVSEFYYNLKTRKAVLTIDCPYMDLESDRELIRHQSKMEDTSYHYRIHTVYPLVRLTINLPTSTHMDLCKAHVHSDVTALPKFHVDPKDKPTANYLSKDLSELYVFERENWYYRGFPVARIFIDHLICDYGCKPHILD